MSFPCLDDDPSRPFMHLSLSGETTNECCNFRPVGTGTLNECKLFSRLTGHSLKDRSSLGNEL